MHNVALAILTDNRKTLQSFACRRNAPTHPPTLPGSSEGPDLPTDPLIDPTQRDDTTHLALHQAWSAEPSIPGECRVEASWQDAEDGMAVGRGLFEGPLGWGEAYSYAYRRGSDRVTIVTS